MISDKEAILSCQAGKSKSYEVLVNRYKSRAYYAALLYAKNRDDALDLSQEAFFRAYKALNNFDVSKNFYTWFYKILKNLCINFVVRRKTHHQISEDFSGGPASQSDADNPEEIFEKNERSQILWSAINCLKEKDKEIILLKEFNNMSYQEIADVLDIPIGSVMSRLYYARQKLLKQLEGLHEDL